MSNEELIEKIEWSIQVNSFAKTIDGDCAHINVEVLKEILAKFKKESEPKEIEFSKNGEGKVLLGIMCRKTKNGKYQKVIIEVIYYYNKIEYIDINSIDNYIDESYQNMANARKELETLEKVLNDKIDEYNKICVGALNYRRINHIYLNNR